MHLAGGRLHAAGVDIGALGFLLEARDVAGVADHPAAGDHEARPRQGLDAAGDLVGIDPVHLVAVVEVGDGADVVGEDEAVGVEGEMAADVAAVADLDLERPIGAGIDLDPGADEAAIDVGARQQIVQIGLDRTHGVFDIGFNDGHRPSSRTWFICALSRTGELPG